MDKDLNSNFLTEVVKKIKFHFNGDHRPFDYNLDFIEKVCEIPVNVFIKFSIMNKDTPFLFITYSLYITHTKLRVCMCGDRYILFFKNYSNFRLTQLNNQTVFDMFQ